MGGAGELPHLHHTSPVQSKRRCCPEELRVASPSEAAPRAAAAHGSPCGGRLPPRHLPLLQAVMEYPAPFGLLPPCRP